MHTKTQLFLVFFCGALRFLSAQNGLHADYYNGQDFNQKIYSRTDAEINFVWEEVAPAPGVDPYVFSVRWTGKIQSPETGIYHFSAHVDDGIRVKVDGQLVINAWGLHDSERVSGQIKLEAGRKYDLVVEYFNGLREGEIQLFWQLPSEKPVFSGAFGYNDHPINGKYFSPPITSVTSTKPSPSPAVNRPKPVQTPPQKPTPVAAKPGAKPTPISRDTLEKYLPKNILFVQSKSEMLPESEPELDRLASFLVRNPQYRLKVDGHTDHVGNSDKNRQLSIERAQAVSAYLSQKGVAAQRITATGYGDTRPLVQEPANKPNARNRRVEFYIQE